MAAITSAATPPEAGSQAPAVSKQAAAQLEKLLRIRLRKCMALLAKVLSEDDPDAVHDLRVWSRRLQQVIVALFHDSLPPEARIMVRALRRACRSLGPWRDCDVLIELLERKARRITDPEERRAWDKVLNWGLRKRKHEMSRERRKLAKRKFLTLPQGAQKLIRQIAGKHDGQDLGPRSVVLASVRKGYAQWREDLSRACGSLSAADMHAFRIQTKRLRYRIELAADLGDGEAQAALAPLKTLQGELGRWHDQTELARLAAEALADPEFLMQHPRAVAAILRKIDRDHTRQIEHNRRLLAATHQAVEHSAIHKGIDRYRGEPPSQAVAQPDLGVVSFESCALLVR